MASTSENGHAKNVSNFENLVVCVISYGSRYSPNKPSLQLSQLEALLAQSKGMLSTVIEAHAEYKVRVNERQTIYAQLKPLSMRLMSALNNSDADDKLIDDAKTYYRKLQGRRANNKVPLTEDLNITTVVRNSVSQQSFTQMEQHFDGLLSIVRRAPAYNPSQADLQMQELTNFKNDLSTKTRAVLDANAELTIARASRDNMFYKAANSLVDIANAVKDEVKSTFGKNSPEYAIISKCRFKKFIKN